MNSQQSILEQTSSPSQTPTLATPRIPTQHEAMSSLSLPASHSFHGLGSWPVQPQQNFWRTSIPSDVSPASQVSSVSTRSHQHVADDANPNHGNWVSSSIACIDGRRFDDCIQPIALHPRMTGSTQQRQNAFWQQDPSASTGQNAISHVAESQSWNQSGQAAFMQPAPLVTQSFDPPPFPPPQSLQQYPLPLPYSTPSSYPALGSAVSPPTQSLNHHFNPPAIAHSTHYASQTPHSNSLHRVSTGGQSFSMPSSSSSYPTSSSSAPQASRSGYATQHLSAPAYSHSSAPTSPHSYSSTSSQGHSPSHSSSVPTSSPAHSSSSYSYSNPPASTSAPSSASSTSTIPMTSLPPRRRRLPMVTVTEGIFWCECGEHFARKGDFERHASTTQAHEPVTIHLCSVCPETFTRRDALQRHMKKGKHCKVMRKKPVRGAESWSGRG